MWFYFHLCMWVIHCGLLLRLPWRTWVAPVRARCGGDVAAWVTGVLAAAGTRELWARAAGKIVLLKDMATSIGQYTPVFLPGEPPDREAWQATVDRVAKCWT